MTSPATHAATVAHHEVTWTAPWVFVMIVGIILTICIGITLIIYATSCYERAEWPWEIWLKNRVPDMLSDEAYIKEQILQREHEERMERIRMGLINE